MRKFKVKVNGTSYEVEVEEISAPKDAQPSAVSAAPKTSPVQAPGEGQEVVTAPMPGNILSVNCSVGDTVAAGQVIAILEAMKMENEIMSPRDGKIIAMNVVKGSTVNSGDIICIVG